MPELKNPSHWLTWGIIAAVLIAILDLPYGYYQLLRLLVTGYAAYLAYLYFRNRPGIWPWVLAFVALLYNPVFIITMSKGFHSFVNALTAGLFIFEFYKLRFLADAATSADSNLGAGGESSLKPVEQFEEICSFLHYFLKSFQAPFIAGIIVFGGFQLIRYFYPEWL